MARPDPFVMVCVLMRVACGAQVGEAGMHTRA
eukprot:COSAG03_NODE_1770_length_3547_cov_2.297274_6_plen_31_part_01